MAQYISPEMTVALKSGRQFPISRVDILNGTTRNLLKRITKVDEGSVTVDVTRGTRRTFQLRLSNTDGEFSPNASSEDDFGFNKLVRVYRGLRYASGDSYVDELVTLGTFMVDRTETFTERNMSVLTVDGSDLWKKIATGGFASPYSYEAGTNINEIIAKVAIDSGVQPNQIALSPLSDRTNDAILTGTTVQWEAGDNRSDFLMNVAKQWGIHIYFNPLGILTSAETPNLDIAEPVWTFESGSEAVLIGVTRVFNDLKLVNHVIVSGESSEGVPSIQYEIVDDDPNSPTYTGLIGDRLMFFSGPQITTSEQAQKTAEKLYAENALIEETVKLPMVCLPHLEGNDVVQVYETLTRVSSSYLCERFDIGLRESRMVIEAKKARAIT